VLQGLVTLFLDMCYISTPVLFDVGMFTSLELIWMLF